MSDLPDRFTVSPEPPTAGDQVTITYTNTDLPEGTQITIDIDNGDGTKDTLTVTIDADGKGVGTFNIPEGWNVLNLNHQSSREHSTAVLS